jgi:uncharacterized protein YndB with AHSA1/START domain
MERKSSAADRELFISRTLDVPVEMAWELWTKPEHLAHWWGPNGFTCTISKMDVTPGGLWNLVLHGPDGTDYDNRSIYKEVIPFKKLVYEHISYPWILATVEFEAQDGKTLVNWHMLFESAEAFTRAAKEHGIAEGLKQNVERMAAYAAKWGI